MRSCGGDMKPSVGSRPTRSVVCCRGALDTVSLGLGNPPRCRMGVKKFCARSAVSQHTVLGYCTPQLSPHAYLRSYMVSHRHISSNLLTTFLSLVFRSTFRELGCLDPTTSVPCLVIFVFSEKRIGGVCSYAYAHCLRARKVLRQQLRHGVCCVHSLASTCWYSARG